ncbi:MAG TPA: ferredoxin--NADP(+) reductase, partial [Lactobacillus sp.]|nr:ferredoxin--NADP(+) reductase [Lactobacillus sp.]
TIDEAEDGTFTLHTSQGDFRSKTVIVATGGGAFTPRKLAVDYDPALEGRQLFYFVQDLETFRDQDVAIAGGGDSAIDWALALEPVAKHVSLIHRRAKFRGLEASVAALEKSSVAIHTPYLIEAVKQENDKLALQLKEVRGDNEPVLTVDKLLVNYGFVTDKRHLQAWQFKTDRNGILVDSQMQTSRPGIFAIGDAVSYAGKLPLIASGFGEAPTAINEALSRLYPERRQALHSTQLYR